MEVSLPQFVKPGGPYYDPCLEDVKDLSNFSCDKPCKYRTLTYLANYLDILDGGNRRGEHILSPVKMQSSDLDHLTPKEYLAPGKPDLTCHTYLKNVAAFLGEHWIYGQHYIKDGFEKVQLDGGHTRESIWFLMGILSEENNAYNFDLYKYVDKEAWTSIKDKLSMIVVTEQVIAGRTDRSSVANFLANYLAGVVKVGEE